MFCLARNFLGSLVLGHMQWCEAMLTHHKDSVLQINYAENGSDYFNNRRSEKDFPVVVSRKFYMKRIRLLLIVECMCVKDLLRCRSKSLPKPRKIIPFEGLSFIHQNKAYTGKIPTDETRACYGLDNATLQRMTTFSNSATPTPKLTFLKGCDIIQRSGQ